MQFSSVGAARRWIGALMVCFAGLIPLTASANSLSYSYDSTTGRLATVTDLTTGQVNTYHYDNNGNVILISTSASSGVSISGFSPSYGQVGTQVTVTGSGFDPTASN